MVAKRTTSGMENSKVGAAELGCVGSEDSVGSWRVGEFGDDEVDALAASLVPPGRGSIMLTATP